MAGGTRKRPGGGDEFEEDSDASQSDEAEEDTDAEEDTGSPAKRPRLANSQKTIAECIQELQAFLKTKGLSKDAKAFLSGLKKATKSLVCALYVHKGAFGLTVSYCY